MILLTISLPPEFTEAGPGGEVRGLTKDHAAGRWQDQKPVLVGLTKSCALPRQRVSCHTLEKLTHVHRETNTKCQAVVAKTNGGRKDKQAGTFKH